jgi:hypothetical protein
MINETIKRIEAKIRDSSLNEEKRQELMRLVDILKKELTNLSEKDAEQARSVAGFAEISSHEATREAKDKVLLDISLHGFTSSVDKFEIEQPELVKAVNSICMLLANLGI